MPGISIHVVDVARGVIAAGMRVEVHALAPRRVLVADAMVSASGTVDSAALASRLEAGEYEARLHVAAFYRRAGVALPGVPFLDVAAFRFGVQPDATTVVVDTLRAQVEERRYELVAPAHFTRDSSGVRVDSLVLRGRKVSGRLGGKRVRAVLSARAASSGLRAAAARLPGP